jgi:hypothetical protein
MPLAYFDVSMSQIVGAAFARIASASRLVARNGTGRRNNRESLDQDDWRGHSRRRFAADGAHFANKAERSVSRSVRSHWDHARYR